MSRTKPVATLSGMIEMDGEEDTLAGFARESPGSNQENGPPPKKKGRTKAAGKRFTKPPSRRTSGSHAVAKKSKPAHRAKATNARAPLQVQENYQDGEETEEVDEFVAQPDLDDTLEELEKPKATAKRKAPSKNDERLPKKVASKKLVPTERDGEFEFTPKAPRIINADAGREFAKRQPLVEQNQRAMIIPESQIPTNTVPFAPSDDNEQARQHRLPQSTLRHNGRPRSNSQRRGDSASRYRAGSISDTERAPGDPAIRRKLGDMTRKLENLDLKYRNLREIGVKEAEENFEKLKTQSEARAKAANNLISSLRRELATQKTLVSDTNSIQTLINARDAELAKTKSQAEQLSTSLAEAQNEIKALQAKLANSRSNPPAVAEMNGSKTPASALRARQQQNNNNNRSMIGSAEAAHAAQIAQMKEDLYSDLTGLIMRGVEIGTDSDVYDCLQTGRNGTLHFKLAIAKETDDSYDETEFQYTPRLDDNRDRNLIALLPEYLTDEITFSRFNAAMFYGRVTETLTKRRKVEVDVDVDVGEGGGQS